MSNRLVEQKRSSLDLSESSSEQDESRRGYGNKDGLTESYGSPEQLYSPDMNATDKPTPKSILKDNAVSASKASKNIYINETLNETHPIAQKSVDSNLSPDQNEYSYKKHTGYPDKFRSGESSLSSKTGEYQSPGKYGSDEDEGYDGKLSSKYTNNSYGQGVSGFKNRLVVGDSSQGPTDFQRAHVRKLQQEREQELYSQAVRDSADAVREKWLLEKAKRSLDADDLKDDKAYSQSHSKGYAVGDDHTEARFEKIKNQVRDLEQNLNSYSKSLTKSEIKQKDRSQNLGKVYGQFEESLREAKEELEQSLNNKGANLERSRGYQSRGFSAGRNSRGNSSDVKEKSGKTKHGHASSVTRSNKKGNSIEKGTTFGKTKAPSKTFKKLQEEISKLQRQNDILRERLGDNEEDDRARRTAQPGPDIDREKDLIDTIDRIKKKLRHNISEKMYVEKKEEINEIQEEAAAKSFGRNYTTLGTSYKDILMRKTYGSTVSSKENSFYKGRSSTSKNYDNTSYSQKLAKSKR